MEHLVAGLQGTILHFLLAICVIFQAAERLVSSSLKIYYAWIIGKCSAATQNRVQRIEPSLLQN
jgi:hypothetical protein